ncbi:Non-structural maintenance of chromosomes element 1 homolog [Linum grandiflorum]
MTELNWRHHTLIQALMVRGPLMENDFRQIYAELTGKNPRTNQKNFNDFMLKINKQLSLVQMELRCCRNQNDGRICYGLVNIVADEQSKLGTKYSLPQIALFKGIIEAIAQDDTAQGSISAITALNLRLETQVQYGSGTQSQGSSEVPAAIRNFSMSQKERTIDELVEEKWLSQTPDGDIELGFRSYLDLRSWFHNMGIPSCEVCNESGVKAKVCPTEGCNVRIHEYCLNKKRRAKGGKIICSSCGTGWPYGIPKSEPPEEEDVQASETETQQGTGLKRKRNRFTGNESASGSAEVSQPADSVRRSTRSGRAR